MARRNLSFIFGVFLFTQACGSLMPGGLFAADEDDVKIKKVAEEAVKQIGSHRSSGNVLKLIDLEDVKTQVVNGIMYHMTLSMGATNCTTGGINDERCIVQDSEIEKCKLKVYQPTGSQTKSPDISVKFPVACRKKETDLLGDEDEETNEHIFKAVAHFGVQELNKKLNSAKKNVLLEVLRARKQTVAGTLYKLTILMAESGCKNDGKPSTKEECPLPSHPKVQRCKVEIFVQLWMKPSHSLKKSQCVPARYARRKRYSVINAGEPRLMLGADGHDIGHFGAFREFMTTHNKTYKSDQELKYRFEVFRKNMKKVTILNQNEQGPDDVKGQYGATWFADFTEEEFKRYFVSPEWDLSKRPAVEADIPRTEAVPKSFDWRDHNAVTEIRNQGMCGSCWAFSTVGNIEGQWSIKKRKLVELSEQELVDCDKVDQGCNGGLPSQAYKEIIRIGGLETEKQYPYDGRGETCKFSRGKAKAYINGSVAISKDENEMAAWLVKNGPISIGINANVMQFYMGGVSHPFSFLCSKNSLDHGVLIVGYGVKKSFWGKQVPYWIVKNSWGKSWGKAGYYLVYRGDGTCGLNQMCTSAVVK